MFLRRTYCVDAEFLPELFNAFIQESDGLSRTHEGTGLGLAITSGIASLMDASIRVESSKGEGSDFVVTLKKAEVSRQRPRRFAGMGNTASA
ncbi:MAG: ATP-binding protein [Rhodothermales bacterium]